MKFIVYSLASSLLALSLVITACGGSLGFSHLANASCNISASVSGIEGLEKITGGTRFAAEVFCLERCGSSAGSWFLYTIIGRTRRIGRNPLTF